MKLANFGELNVLETALNEYCRILDLFEAQRKSDLLVGIVTFSLFILWTLERHFFIVCHTVCSELLCFIPIKLKAPWCFKFGLVMSQGPLYSVQSFSTASAQIYVSAVVVGTFFIFSMKLHC